MDTAAVQKKDYRELRTETEFLKNLIAAVINRFGDSIDAIAFTWMVYSLSGSAALTAATFGANTLTSVVLQPFTSALITNMNKKRILVLSDIGRGVLVSLIAILYFLGLLQPWMLIVSTILMSTFEAFRIPCGVAIYPKIVTKEKYTLAMSLNGALTRIAEIIGMGIAGTVIAVLGIPGALLIDAVTFFASAGILFTLRFEEEGGSAISDAMSTLWADTKEGFHYVISHPLTLSICLSACVINFVFTPYSALQTAFVSEGLQMGAQALSVIGLAMSGGSALGAILFPRIVARTSRYILLCVGVLAAALGIVGLSAITLVQLLPLKWALIVIIPLFTGIGLALCNTSVSVSFMEKTEEAYLARVNGIMNSMCMAAMPIGSFLAAMMARSLPVSLIVAISGVFIFIVSIGCFFVRPLREL